MNAEAAREDILQTCVSMNLYELAARVIEALEVEEIPYMVVGALSGSVFGIPRATKDVLRCLRSHAHSPPWPATTTRNG